MDAFDDLEAHLSSLNSIVDQKQPQQQQQHQQQQQQQQYQQQQQQQQQQHPAIPQLQYLKKATLMLQQSLEKNDLANSERYRNACLAAIQNLRECQKSGVPQEIELHIQQAFAQVKTPLCQLKELQQQQPNNNNNNNNNSPQRHLQNSPQLHPHNSPTIAVQSHSSPQPSSLSPHQSPHSGRKKKGVERVRSKKMSKHPERLGSSEGLTTPKSSPQITPTQSASFETGGSRRKKMTSAGTVREKRVSKGRKSGGGRG